MSDFVIDIKNLYRSFGDKDVRVRVRIRIRSGARASPGTEQDRIYV